MGTNLEKLSQRQKNKKIKKFMDGGIPQQKWEITLQSWESDFKRSCLPVYKKTGWEADPQLIEGVETVSKRKIRGRCEP